MKINELFSKGEIITSRTVWAVMFGNYEPSEIDSLWDTEEDADKRAAQLDGDWRVFQMGVFKFN